MRLVLLQDSQVSTCSESQSTAALTKWKEKSTWFFFAGGGEGGGRKYLVRLIRYKFCVTELCFIAKVDGLIGRLYSFNVIHTIDNFGRIHNIVFDIPPEKYQKNDNSNTHSNVSNFFNLNLDVSVGQVVNDKPNH